MEFELVARKYNSEYFGIVYGVLRDYHILTKENEIKVLVDDWVDITAGKINNKLMRIEGPYSGDLGQEILLDGSSYKEMDRLATFVTNTKGNYKGFGK